MLTALLFQVAKWWATGGDPAKASRFRGCADCIHTVTAGLLTARQQAATWACILLSLAGRKRRLPTQPATAAATAAGGSMSMGVPADATSTTAGTSTAAAATGQRLAQRASCSLVKWLTRDVIELIGRQMPVLASSEVVGRTQLQPQRDVYELPAAELLPFAQGSSGDRDRALRAWRRSRRQVQGSGSTTSGRGGGGGDLAAASSHLQKLQSGNGSRFGVTKRRR
jgi:hypothetical protein